MDLQGIKALVITHSIIATIIAVIALVFLLKYLGFLPNCIGKFIPIKSRKEKALSSSLDSLPPPGPAPEGAPAAAPPADGVPANPAPEAKGGWYYRSKVDDNLF